MTLRAQIDAAVAQVRNVLPKGASPRVGLILGSGLGSFADTLVAGVKIPYAEIAALPKPTVAGHAGHLVYGRAKAGGVEVLALQGRVHFYEGHDFATVALPARVLIAAGCNTLIVTNAAGGIDSAFKPGDIVVIRDHINMLGGSPLRGSNDDAVGPRFVDMTNVYDKHLRVIAHEIGAAIGVKLHEGVYAAMPGPQYETPAEVKMLRTLGADLVGMSTVPEAIVASHMGAKVLGLSCVTNLAAGISGDVLSHAEVTETADRVKQTFEALLRGILERLS